MATAMDLAPAKRPAAFVLRRHPGCWCRIRADRVLPGPLRYVGSLKALYAHPYNRMRPWFALYRFAHWQARKRIGTAPWDQTIWGGRRRFRFFPDSRESMFLAYNHIMDWHEFHFMARYLRATDVAVDVGANIGVYLLWMSNFVGPEGRIIAFEPDATNSSRISTQITINSLSWVEMEQAAVAEQEGELRFSTGKDMENHIVRADTSEDAETVTVRATTLDNHARREDIESIDFLKIDVEGAELFILQGAERLLRDRAIRVIQLEFNRQAGTFELHSRDVLAFLDRHGYALFRYHAEDNALSEVGAPDAEHCNLFATADIGHVNRRLTDGRSARVG